MASDGQFCVSGRGGPKQVYIGLLEDNVWFYKQIIKYLYEDGILEKQIDRTLKGEKTAAAEATDFWKEAQEREVSKGPSVGGAFKYVGAEFAKGLSCFISCGQDDLWGIL